MSGVLISYVSRINVIKSAASIWKPLIYMYHVFILCPLSSNSAHVELLDLAWLMGKIWNGCGHMPDPLPAYPRK